MSLGVLKKYRENNIIISRLYYLDKFEESLNIFIGILMWSKDKNNKERSLQELKKEYYLDGYYNNVNTFFTFVIAKDNKEENKYISYFRELLDKYKTVNDSLNVEDFLKLVSKNDLIFKNKNDFLVKLRWELISLINRQKKTLQEKMNKLNRLTYWTNLNIFNVIWYEPDDIVEDFNEIILYLIESKDDIIWESIPYEEKWYFYKFVKENISFFQKTDEWKFFYNFIVWLVEQWYTKTFSEYMQEMKLQTINLVQLPNRFKNLLNTMNK